MPLSVLRDKFTNLTHAQYKKLMGSSTGKSCMFGHEFVMMQVLPTDYGGQAELIPLQVYVKDHLPKTQVISTDVCLLKVCQLVVCMCYVSVACLHIIGVRCAGEPRGMKTFMQNVNPCRPFTFVCQFYPLQQTLMSFGGGEHQG